ncbi:MAG: Appr-1-p processing protein [bacterium]
MIGYIEGNLLEAKNDIICHQVNCRGSYGAGLAKQIATKYPKSKHDYFSFCDGKRPKDLLGEVLITKTDVFYIAHLFGQNYYGDYGIYMERLGRQTIYPALECALRKLKNIYPNKSYGFPYLMGCGLAGGKWSVVRGLIDRIFKENDVTIYHYKRK